MTSALPVATRGGNRPGFTLLELMVVTVIISLLALIAVGPVLKMREKAMVAAARVELAQTVQALEMYTNVHHGALPDDVSDLAELGHVLSGDMVLCRFNITGASASDYEARIDLRHRGADTGVTTLYPTWSGRIDELAMADCAEVEGGSEEGAGGEDPTSETGGDDGAGDTEDLPGNSNGKGNSQGKGKGKGN